MSFCDLQQSRHKALGIEGALFEMLFIKKKRTSRFFKTETLEDKGNLPLQMCRGIALFYNSQEKCKKEKTFDNNMDGI